VREAAKKEKGQRFTALLHHVNEGLLLDSFYSLKRQAAPGVDEVTWREYEPDVEARIRDLHGRVHRGAYRAQPSRRVYIPKPDGRQRPLGIAALEDKIVQQAMVTVLNSIYEGDFVGFSYGFRPGKGAHDALDALSYGIVRKKVNWVLDADIRGFFDNIDHTRLMEWIERRIADPRVLRLIQKWLKAGVSEEGEYICSTIHKSGRFTVKRKTIGKRLAGKLKEVKAKLRERMHWPVAEVGKWLGTVVRGYYNYHAIPGNYSRLRSFRHDVARHWWQALRRRSQRPLRREVFESLVAQYLPQPAILHPYPWERFCAKHPS